MITIMPIIKITKFISLANSKFNNEFQQRPNESYTKCLCVCMCEQESEKQRKRQKDV